LLKGQTETKHVKKMLGTDMSYVKIFSTVISTQVCKVEE
jgi:hypothetical protein